MYQSHVKMIEVLIMVILDCGSMHAFFFERQAVTAELGFFFFFFLEPDKLEIS